MQEHLHSLLNFDTGHVVVVGAAGLVVSKFDNYTARWIAVATAIYVTLKLLRFLYCLLKNRKTKNIKIEELEEE